MSIRTEQVSSCPLCQNPGTLVYENLKDRLFKTEGSWSHCQCINDDCQLIWLNPRPIQEDIMKVYEYYLTHGESENIYTTKTKNIVKNIVLTWMKNMMRTSRLNDWVKYVHYKGFKPGRLLEVGCGDGRKLALLKEKGWVVTGQDLDPNAVKKAKESANCEVHLGELQDIHFEEGAFDLVMMSHVIEHVYNPQELITECMYILRPGGRLIMVTQNTESLGHKEFQCNWIGLDPPRHLHIFNLKTLRIMVNTAGFSECIAFSSASNAALLNLTSYDLKTNDAPIYQVKMLHGLKALAFELREKRKTNNQNPLGEECVVIAIK